MSTHGIDAAAGSIPVADVPRSGALGAAQSALGVVNGVLAVVSAIAIAAAGLVLTWEVMGRYFFAIPSDWQDELSTFLLIGATFGAAAWIQARRGHVAIDALTHVLPPGLDEVRRVLADLLSFLFVTFFAWKSWALFYEAWDEGQTTPSAWGPPLWIPYGCMALGMSLLSLQLLLQVVGSRHRESDPAHLAPSPPLPVNSVDGERALR
ncbi:MAG: TRAP transporter small permease [Acetobacteraceae bacterium]|nr:TRAP transporter small permease [Acetobacteraceae bacterium]